MPSTRGAAWKWWVCGLLLLATMINYMDRLTLNLLADTIKTDLSFNAAQYGYIEAAFAVAFGVGAIVFGWVVASHQLGAAFATFAAGAIRTQFGSYAPAFVGAGALCVIAALAVLPIARAKRLPVAAPA